MAENRGWASILVSCAARPSLAQAMVTDVSLRCAMSTAKPGPDKMAMVAAGISSSAISDSIFPVSASIPLAHRTITVFVLIKGFICRRTERVACADTDSRTISAKSKLRQFRKSILWRRGRGMFGRCLVLRCFWLMALIRRDFGPSKERRIPPVPRSKLRLCRKSLFR